LAESYDVVVVGAGSFGAWTAYQLRRSLRSVALLDAYGVGNSRGSSGDESRIMRMAYGRDEIYTRWAQRSLDHWTELFEQVNQRELFQPTGVLWTPAPNDARTQDTTTVLERCGVLFHVLSGRELRNQFPQFHFSSERIGIFEPDSGVLLARRAVRAVVEEAVRNGVDYFRDAAGPPSGASIAVPSGKIHAEAFVYACGPWLPKIFPSVLRGRIRSTRQEVFFFGPDAGDRRFSSAEMPAWVDFADERGPYAVPDLDNRGVKTGFDRHGPEFDPDTDDRTVRDIKGIRSFLAERLPALAKAPLVESRVCQYESTSTGDFLIDRHPDFENVWLVGGGSGHGFKHGPMVGEYVTAMLEGSITPEPRFSLASKTLESSRAVY